MFRRSIPLLVLLIGWLFCWPACRSTSAQLLLEQEEENASRFGPPLSLRYRVGAEITASRGAVRNVHAMVAVPLECDEQTVTLLEEDVSPGVDAPEYRLLPGGGARQMLIRIPFLANGKTATVVATFEVQTRPTLLPQAPEQLQIPQRIDRSIRQFVNGSPFIEVKHNQVRSLSRELEAELENCENDWQRVEKIYDYVLDNIDYVEGPDKSALNTIRDGYADCQGRSAIFIALCRAQKIPARMVWVEGHAYPEFYLERPADPAAGEEGEAVGEWYPCESAGVRAFGEMPLARTILQKGDNFRVPERPRDRLRYASDYLVGVPTPGAGPPQVRYIRQQIID